MSSGFTKYGVQWNGTRLSVELECIRKGGILKKKDGSVTQIPLFDLYKEAMTLLWPEDDWHRWAEMFLREILANKVTGVCGPQNSGKTYIASKYALADFWAFPHTTGILISSTDLRGLELRVWGTIKQLFNRATDKWGDLEGNVIESLHAVTPDNVNEGYARVLKKGIICIPCLQSGRYVGLGKYCFVAGTMVDTPTGPKPIETVKAGDMVISAIGPSRVYRTMQRSAESLVRVHLSSGRHIDCTPNHEFLTASGWVNAIDILPKTELYSVHDTLHCLREGLDQVAGQAKEVLFQGVPAQHLEKGMQLVQEEVHSNRTESDLLFSILRSEMEDESAFDSQKDDRIEGLGCCRKEHQQRNSCKQTGHRAPSKSHDSCECSVGKGEKETRTECLLRIRNWPQEHACRGVHTLPVHRSTSRFHYSDWKVIKTWEHSTLPSGLRVARNQVGSRSGRQLPQPSRTGTQGLHQRCVAERERVDRIEVLQQTSDPRHGEGEGSYPVYNLSVEGHPSYSVEGVIVHNCGFKMPRVRLISDEASLMGPSFLDAISNLAGNPDFKAVIMGNPIDPLDPLGMACEPEQGWTNMAEPTVTTVWKTKFLDGKCINFVGTDSPNFDPPVVEGKPRYPYMIGPRTVKEVEAFWGRDSQQFWSQVMGVMKTGLLARRVITRDLCREHHALDRAFWEGLNRTKVYAVDAAYSGTGGDRCVGGWVEFGQSSDGPQILRVNPPSIIPVSVKLKESPEDQIAAYVKREIEREDIPPTSVFYDSTGRGTLGSAFARLFGNATPVPVEFGGRPTERPVRFDLFIDDDGERRWKTCREHYVDFVSELWFSVRYAIESEQIRELPEDVMKEGCGREYGTSKNNKFFVESKHDKKARERMGRSPDLFDWLVTAVEGARRLGFKIQKLGSSRTEEGSEGDWFLEEEQRYEDVISSKLLQHA